ncbi:MAG: hypothetical protein ACOY0T_11365 [Myxococcota bacterium]
MKRRLHNTRNIGAALTAGFALMGACSVDRESHGGSGGTNASSGTAGKSANNGGHSSGGTNSAGSSNRGGSSSGGALTAQGGTSNLTGGSGTFDAGETSAGGDTGGTTNTSGGASDGGEAGARGTSCTKPANGPAQCTTQCPCAIGAGQCTNNDGCNAGLVCGTNTGAKFGFAGNTCVPKHCDDDALNADETSVDCGGECGCTAEFTRLGFLSATEPSSTAAAVNADGSVVVGSSMDIQVNVIRPFRWIDGKGIARLSGDLGGPGRNSEGVAVSSDGTIVGGNLASGQMLPEEPFVWSLAAGLVKVAPGDWAHLQGLSADGRVGVGRRNPSGALAWGPGIPKVGNIGSSPYSSALDASGNGAVVVGFATDGSGLVRATVWSGDTATLLDGPTGSVAGSANAITPDAAVIVGSIETSPATGSTPTHRAIVWTQGANGYTVRQIEDIAGGADDNEAIDVSADGRIVIGWGTSAVGREPLIWDRVGGTRRLLDELKARGFEWPSAVSIGNVAAISGNGTTIVGTYQNPEGHTEAWRIRLN